MGRASRIESARSRERIVQTASRMFAEKGVDNVSIADIMHAAGLTHGGFYNHFPSKDALAVEAIQASFERATEKWKESAASGAGRKSPLQTIVENYLSIAPTSGKCPIVSSGYDAIAGGREEFKTAFSSGAHQLFDEFRKAAQATDRSIPEWQYATLFAAALGARVLVESAGQEPWVKDILKAIPIAIRNGSGDR
ncbi:TetR/AcrR family transcriptional regulator [Cupriavidus sp. 2SB]|uniref:TetR/AcrR family transcriptional regulator n=1 Tax=Cupriavidus sp. 2SB TaxID=2502199 RepID=UPI0024B5E3AE|nr:TetR/AcrR family transcriptional regulator [Cupriavidus sp. 2SB]